MLRAVAAVLLAAALSPLAATPAAASHACVDDVPCYPHVEPDDPDVGKVKGILLWLGDTARCLVLAQPPTACL